MASVPGGMCSMFLCWLDMTQCLSFCVGEGKRAVFPSPPQKEGNHLFGPGTGCTSGGMVPGTGSVECVPMAPVFLVSSSCPEG